MAIDIFENWSDGLEGQAVDNHTNNGGRTFANENCLLVQTFDQFLQMSGVCPRGMLMAGIDLHKWNGPR